MTYKEKIDTDKLPAHIAVIMDGNGRWAKQKGNHRIFGHRNGVNAVRETVEAAAELGIACLTLYAFSTENWQRPRMEVDALMALLVSSLHDETPTLMKNNIRLMTIGNISALSPDVTKQLQATIEKTTGNTGLKLILALNYSGRWEILQATQHIQADAAAGKLTQPMNETTFVNYLSTRDLPDPELLIRTSGELRISNFLLWQLAYTELYFTPTLWPDFRKEDLHKAIVDFQQRERRFGKTGEQVEEYELSSQNQ
ncbi:MAG: isoprenyl transferase [Bacteroidales bacterium]|jgi:undecaprenyl diphosphate synthase|nr:isoprenyl transferase [Bacteroidales bacterium]